MSKKKETAKKKEAVKKPCKCKKKVLITLAVVLALVLGFGVYRLVTYNSSEHSNWMDKDEKTEYNTALTQHAWRTAKISRNEILLLKSVNKNLGGDSQLEFYVYQLPDGAKSTDYLHLDANQVSSDSGLIHIGTATCRLAGGKISSIYSLEVKYIR